MSGDQAPRLGWIGVGRMGRMLATRLLQAGCDLAVYNRTRAKAEPLAELGARIVESPVELGDRDVVFTMVAGSEDVPEVIIDSTTISPSVAAEIRAEVESRGVAMLAAPVSGNPKVARAGRLTIV